MSALNDGYWLKWTNMGRVPNYQGGRPLPKPGVWSEHVPDPVLCQRGWHACRYEDAVEHIAVELWVCDLDGPIIEGGNGRPDACCCGITKSGAAWNRHCCARRAVTTITTGSGKAFDPTRLGEADTEQLDRFDVS